MPSRVLFERLGISDCQPSFPARSVKAETIRLKIPLQVKLLIQNGDIVKIGQAIWQPNNPSEVWQHASIAGIVELNNNELKIRAEV